MSDLTEIVKRAASGDRASFDSLYEKTKKGVWFTCISLLKNEENAKDIMQDTYLAAFEKLNTLEDYSAVQSWLNRIAANKCKNHISAKANSTLEENGEEILENIPDDRFLPEEYVTEKAKRELIMNIIENALSEEQYRTIILYYFDELTAAEIAELMNCHEKTVLYRLKTARSKIKDEITRYEKENHDKLYAVLPVPILTRLFRVQAENVSVPHITVLPVAADASGALNVPSAQTATAVKTGGKAMLNSLKAKIIAGTCAAVVVGGGVAAVVITANNSENRAESRPAISAHPKEESPAEYNPADEDYDDREEHGSAPDDNEDEPVTSAGEVLWDIIPTASEDDFTFALYKMEGKSDFDAVMITEYLGDGGYVKIPPTYNGKPVKGVDGFSHCDTLKGIMMPDSVTTIGSSAFSNCEELVDVVFPSALERIDRNAFEYCESLKSVVLPEGLQIIEEYAFSLCDDLTSVTLPNSLVWVGKRAFFIDCCEIHYKGQTYDPDGIDELFGHN